MVCYKDLFTPTLWEGGGGGGVPSRPPVCVGYAMRGPYVVKLYVCRTVDVVSTFWWWPLIVFFCDNDDDDDDDDNAYHETLKNKNRCIACTRRFARSEMRRKSAYKGRRRLIPCKVRKRGRRMNIYIPGIWHVACTWYTIRTTFTL